jgi:hypothetical protein
MADILVPFERCERLCPNEVPRGIRRVERRVIQTENADGNETQANDRKDTSREAESWTAREQRFQDEDSAYLDLARGRSFPSSFRV